MLAHIRGVAARIPARLAHEGFGAGVDAFVRREGGLGRGVPTAFGAGEGPVLGVCAFVVGEVAGLGEFFVAVAAGADGVVGVGVGVAAEFGAVLEGFGLGAALPVAEVFGVGVGLGWVWGLFEGGKVGVFYVVLEDITVFEL